MHATSGEMRSRLEPRRREVTIERDGVLLAGNLSLPARGGPVPFVVFVQWPGKQQGFATQHRHR
jgi:predicted acyl esterase